MSKLNVCYCVDRGFEKYTIASIISLFLNSKIKLKIHIIINKYTDKKKLRLVEKLFKTRFKYYLVDDSLFYGLPILGGYSVYYRLLIPDLLSKNINEVLYLDCDTIIEEDLSELLNINLTNKALCAVEDVLIGKINFKEFRKRLNIPKNSSYFNSGVMFLNLNYIRRKKLFKKVITFLKKKTKNVVMHDQDGLNAILYNLWIKLPNSYNHIMKKDLLLSNNNNYKIIHFAGFKPEVIRLINPKNKYYKKYYEYLKMVNIKKEEINDIDLLHLLKKVYSILIK